jgi:hypothetical protein
MTGENIESTLPMHKRGIAVSQDDDEGPPISADGRLADPEWWKVPHAKDAGAVIHALGVRLDTTQLYPVIAEVMSLIYIIVEAIISCLWASRLCSLQALNSGMRIGGL